MKVTDCRHTFSRFVLPSIFVKNSKSKLLPSLFLVNGAAPISILLASGPCSCTDTVSYSWGISPSYQSGSTPMLFTEVLNAKPENSMHYYSSLWHDSIGYRTPTYRAQGKHSTTGSRTRSPSVYPDITGNPT